MFAPRGQLSDGKVSGNDIICSLHGYDFDIVTGVSRYDTSERVATYPARIRDGRIEIDADAVPPLPADHDEGYLARWTRPSDPGLRGYEYLSGLSGGEAPTAPMGTRRTLQPSWDDILMLPAQVARRPLLDEESLSLRTVIGQRADRPLVLGVPMFVSHMSFGALSATAKIALARVASRLGTAIGSGEGGMLPEEREAASRYIFEMASGYFGWTAENIAQADAVELKFGQSAKAGAGGFLPGSKVSQRIAEVRGLEPGQAAHSPARFVDLDGPEALRRRVDEIRDRIRGGPVGIKFAAGRVEEDVDAALDAGADFITIDGRGGGTGSAPLALKDNLTIPIQYALFRARRRLAERGRSDVDLLATGGFRSSGDIAKALALGARAVALGTASMVAIGCQQYLACDTGACPVGIATQRADLEARFDVDLSTERGVATFEALRLELELMARAVGVSDIHDLTPADLATVDSEISAHTDIAHA
ncbi:MAG: glutamate synthase-related protein [Chloroflexi bacterium]|nr:glutamate synthase-related protein [Chloroflexota bacterium]